MKKVLITGGAGFIGFHLAKKLVETGHSVDLADNYSRGVIDVELKALSSLAGVRLLNRDLLKRDSLDDLDSYEYIYHLAAILGVANVLDRPFDVLKDNVAMLTNVISLAQKQKKIKRLVFTSTSEVYAGTLKHFELPFPTPEKTPLALTDLNHPRTSYMLSKIYGEALCQHSGLPYTLIRPHNIYGPRMGLSHVIPELIKKVYQAKEDSELELFSPDHKRTFCFVEDAIQFLTRSAESAQCENETLNIGTEAPEIKIRDLAKIILKILDKELEIDEKPPTPGSPERRAPYMKKTETLTGYSPKIGLEEGVKQTFVWYKKHIFDGHKVCAK